MGTALFDAIGKTLQLMTSLDPPKVLVAILTDGQENDSQEFKEKKAILELIKACEGKGWQFVYLASGPDAMSGQSFGISASFRASHSAEGMTVNYMSMNANSRSYRTGIPIVPEAITNDSDFAATPEPTTN